MGEGGEGGGGRGLGIVLIHYTHAFINSACMARLRDTLHMTIRIWAYLCNYISLHTALGSLGVGEGKAITSITSASILKRDLCRALPLGLMALSLL